MWHKPAGNAHQQEEGWKGRMKMCHQCSSALKAHHVSLCGWQTGLSPEPRPDRSGAGPNLSSAALPREWAAKEGLGAAVLTETARTPQKNKYIKPRSNVAKKPAFTGFRRAQQNDLHLKKPVCKYITLFLSSWLFALKMGQQASFWIIMKNTFVCGQVSWQMKSHFLKCTATCYVFMGNCRCPALCSSWRGWTGLAAENMCLLWA